MEIGTLVKVIVDHPYGAGCEEVNVFGQIGVIVAIEYYPRETIYIVHTRDFRDLEGFSYHEEELREITDEEARRELYNILMEAR